MMDYHTKVNFNGFEMYVLDRVSGHDRYVLLWIKEAGKTNDDNKAGYWRFDSRKSQCQVVQVSAPLALEISSNNSSRLPVAQMLISTNNKCPLDFADSVPEASKIHHPEKAHKASLKNTSRRRRIH
jgi:hypothetical protein